MTLLYLRGAVICILYHWSNVDELLSIFNVKLLLSLRQLGSSYYPCITALLYNLRDLEKLQLALCSAALSPLHEGQSSNMIIM